MSEYGLDRKQLRDAILDGLRAYKKSGRVDNNSYLNGLLLVRKGVEESDVESKLAKHYVINQLLHDSLNELQHQNGEFADILRERFIQGRQIQEIANSRNENSVDVINRLQRKALDNLAGIIYEKELSLRVKTAEKIESHLPASQYTKLIGFDEAVETLFKNVIDEERSWVVASVGLGGMGKTALTDYVTRQIIRLFRFEDVFWIYVESPPFEGSQNAPKVTYSSLLNIIGSRLWPDVIGSFTKSDILLQVRRRLKERPYLIIIDNLEAASDAAILLDHLNELSNPSKFLITTRTTPSRQSRVFSYQMKDLSFPQAAELLRYHAEERGLDMMQEADETVFREIYSVTGGNPLVLRLVVSLLDTYTLPRILDDLKKTPHDEVEAMYRRLYWQSWHSISEKAKKLLKVMPLVVETGATIEFLQRVSGMDENEIWPLLSELKSRSLVESRGGLMERRFTIHKVTSTFLQTEIINWNNQAWQG